YDIQEAPGWPFAVLTNDHRFDRFNIKSHWLAFNPVLARELNWVRGRHGQFSWLNAEGSTIVKSYYWSDGNMEMQPPKLDNETGEGWFVVLSKDGLESLKTKWKNLFLEKRLVREYSYEGHKYKEAHRTLNLT